MGRKRARWRDEVGKRRCNDAGNLELVGNSNGSRRVEETFEGNEDCV
jgi:hypothetical protein